jgi:hypothetical protein
MSNTTIQILRSYANTAPGNLADGELAFSFLSNTLFIGSTTLNVETQLWSNNIISIGGPDYIANVVSVIDGGIFS